MYTNQWGTYDVLTYSTWEVNPPNPTGYAPTMMVTCMNDPGSIFFFQAEDGIRHGRVTGVQTCALPIYARAKTATLPPRYSRRRRGAFDRPAGVWHSHQHGARERPADRPGRHTLGPRGYRAPGVDPRRSAARRRTSVLMAALASPTVRQALRLAGYVLLTLLVYWVNAVTPSTARFGILYTIPVLLVTWTEGLAWGILLAVATTVFREATAWVQMPADTPLQWRILNGLAYLAVLG